MNGKTYTNNILIFLYLEQKSMISWETTQEREKYIIYICNCTSFSVFE